MAVRVLARFGIGVLGTLVALEILLRLLPVSTATMTGYHRDPEVLTYPPHHSWRMATGWDLRNPQTMQANGWGFAAEHEFEADPDAVALIGDSYVEASMLDLVERPAAQLERALGGRRPVYAMGTPGTALLDHAQRIRVAASEFDVRDVVLLLERSDARQSLCGSGNVVSRCLDRVTLERRTERMPEPGLFKRVARHSALAQYLGSQLKFRPSLLWRSIFTRSTPESERGSDPADDAAPTAGQIAEANRLVDAVVDAFFDDARPWLKGRLVVAVDARRSATPGRADALIDVERDRMMARLAQGGAIVVDLAPVFGTHRAASSRSLVVGPYDGHMNAVGVGLAMQAVAERLR